MKHHRISASAVAPSAGSIEGALRRAARPVLIVCLMATALAALPNHGFAQASTVTPLGTHQATLSGADDSSQAVSITDVFANGINFGGTVYTELHIGTNGYVTFGHGNSSYNPQGIAGYTNGPIVAPQFDDLDPSQGGDIWYDQNPAGGYLVVTWESVVPYRVPSEYGSGTNTLQVVLRQVGGSTSQDFQIEIRYPRISWAGSGNISSFPTAGWSAGDGTTYGEVPYSGQSNFHELQNTSNVGETGVFRWDVQGGVVESTPTVNQTHAATSITGSGATSGGNVSSDGGLTVTDRGLVWSTSSGPTLSSSSVREGSGTGSFSATMEGLSTSTTYYVRAYATNSLGTSYGPQIQFTTPSVVPPTVTTDSVTAVTHESARVDATVTADGGGTVVERGVAFGTSASPTTAGATVTSGSGTGGFAALLEGLDPITTYHARAYAVNSEGTSYGDAVSFTTEQLPQSIELRELEVHSYGDPSDTLTATASSGLDVELSTDDPAVATVSGGTLTIHGAGTTTITATQGGNELYASAEPVSRRLRVLPRGLTGHFTVESEKIYDESPAAVLTGTSLAGVLEADEGQVELTAEAAHFADAAVGDDKSVSLVGAALAGPRAAHYTLREVAPATADLLPAPPHHVTLDGPEGFTVGESTDALTLTVRDQYGNATPVPQRMTLSLGTDGDAGAEFIRPDASVMNDPALTISTGATRARFRYRHSVAGSGVHRITATRIHGPQLAGGTEAIHDLAVRTGGWTELRIEITGDRPDGSIEVGDPVQIRVIAVDEFGNRVRGTQGALRLEVEGPLVLSGGPEGELYDGTAVFPDAHFTGPGAFTLRARAEGLGERTMTVESGTINVLNPNPDVVLSVEVDRPRAGPGEVVEFIVRAENHGAGPAENLRLRNPLAGTERLEVLEVTATGGTWMPDEQLWRIDTLEAGGSAVLTIRARATGG